MVYAFLDSPLKHLEWLEKNWSLDAPLKDHVFSLKQELRFLRTYLIFIAISDAIPSGSISIISSVEVALTKASEDISSACLLTLDSATTYEKVDSVISCMLQKVKHCQPEIRKGYGILEKQPLESESNVPVLPASLLDFIDSVLENLRDLLHCSKCFNDQERMSKKLQSLKKKLSFLRHFLQTIAKSCTMHHRMGHYLTYLCASCASAASLSYFCWTARKKKIMEFGIVRKLSDLVEKITTGTCLDVIEMYVELLKTSNLKESDNARIDEVGSFVNFLLEDSFCSSITGQIASVHEELINLITYLIDPPNECRGDWEWLAADIKAVAREAGSFYVDDMNEDQVEQMNLVLSRLLIKMNLIKAEIFLVRLQSHELGLIVRMKDQVETFQKELRFLRTFLKNPPMNNKDQGRLILRKTEAVANEAASLVFQFHDSLNNEEMPVEMNHLISELLQKIVLLKEEIMHIHLEVLPSLHSKYPMVDVLVFISSLSENMRELVNKKAYSIAFVKHHIQIIQSELGLLKSFLMDSISQHIDCQELHDLWVCITDIAYKAEYAIASFVVRDDLLWYFMLWLSVAMEEIEVIRTKIMKICDYNGVVIGVHSSANSSQLSPFVDNSLDLKYEALMLIYQLIGGKEMWDIIAVIGMPGLGKTALAEKVYHDPSVVNFFDIRIWYRIDREYEHREALIDISCYTDIRIPNYTYTEEYDIQESLYYFFKGKKYLFVLEDWNISAWEYLKRIFPHNRNGSRLLFIC